MTTPRAELRRTWEAQQALHAPDREQRFRLMLDYVEDLAGVPRRVLDLACGPGSITHRILTRFAATEVVALDIDPVLLELASDAFEAEPRVSVVERQLTDPDWTDGLTGGFDAVLTATAMHWIPADSLPSVYAGVARLLRSGGIFAVSDHFPVAEPVLRAAGDRLHESYLRAAVDDGAEDCDRWYDRAYAVPEYAGLWERRQKVFAQWEGELLEREGWHIDILRRSGFERAGTVWRRGNDAVVVAVRA